MIVIIMNMTMTLPKRLEQRIKSPLSLNVEAALSLLHFSPYAKYNQERKIFSKRRIFNTLQRSEYIFIFIRNSLFLFITLAHKK